MGGAERSERPRESQAVQLEGVGLVSASSLVLPGVLLETAPPPSSHSSALSRCSSPFVPLQAVSARTVLTESSAETHRLVTDTPPGRSKAASLDGPVSAHPH